MRETYFPLHKNVFIMLTFFIVLSANIMTCCLCIILLVTTDGVYLNSMRFKHIDSSYHFLKLNYRGLSLNFLKIKTTADGVIQSNPKPTNSDKSRKMPRGRPKKIKVFKGKQKSVNLVKTLMLILLVIQRYKMFLILLSLGQLLALAL